MIPGIYRPGLSISPQRAGEDRGLWTARQVAVVALLAAMAMAALGGLLWLTAVPVIQFVSWAGGAVLHGAAWVVLTLLMAGGLL